MILCHSITRLRNVILRNAYQTVHIYEWKKMKQNIRKVQIYHYHVVNLYNANEIYIIQYIYDKWNDFLVINSAGGSAFTCVSPSLCYYHSICGFII